MSITNISRALLVSSIFLFFSAAGVPTSRVELINPVGNEKWLVGSEQLISWYGIELQGPYRVEIQRRPGARWQLIGQAVDGNSYSWLVSGPATRRARIKVTDIPSGKSDTNETPFTIYRR